MNLKGTFFVLIFLFFVSVSGVYQGHLSQTISPLVFLFFTSFVAMAFFGAASLSQSRSSFFRKCARHRRELIWLNVCNLLVWGCYVYGLKYLEPAIAVMIANAIGPVLVILFSKYLLPKSKIFLSEKIASIGIVLSLVFIIYSTLAGKSAVVTSDLTHLSIGVFIVLLMGVGQVLFSLFSKRLHESNFSTVEIAALRFPLAVVIAFLFLDKQETVHLLFSAKTAQDIILISFLGMLIPIYFFQKGIRLIEPIFLSILMLIEPVIMFAGQSFDPRLKISIFSYVGVFFVCLFSLISVLGRYLQSRNDSA